MSEPNSFQPLGPVKLRGTEAFRIHSRHADAEYEIRVAEPVPSIMGDAGVRPHILYVTDGDLYFGMATDVTRLMHLLFRERPPVLVVGIGYGTDDARLQGEIRNRDLTPTEDPAFEEMARRMSPGREPALPPGRRVGRAGPFLDFIERELDPFLRTRYGVADEAGTLFGSSMGGLFATWALLTRPHVFSRYIILSPALWWDGGALLSQEEGGSSDVSGQRAGGGDADTDVSARVYVAAGEREEGSGIPGLDQWKLVTNARRMAELLEARPLPSLRVAFEVLPGESHTSAVPVGLTRGLRSVLGAGSPGTRPSTRG